jgi:hypothetical protein
MSSWYINIYYNVVLLPVRGGGQEIGTCFEWEIFFETIRLQDHEGNSRVIS